MKKLLMLSIVALTVFASCSKDNKTEPQDNNSENNKTAIIGVWDIDAISTKVTNAEDSVLADTTITPKAGSYMEFKNDRTYHSKLINDDAEEAMGSYKVDGTFLYLTDTTPPATDTLDIIHLDQNSLMVNLTSNSSDSNVEMKIELSR